MAVKFPDEIHPKKGLKIRFAIDFRPLQYLEYFHIIETYPNYKFSPLDLTFESINDLTEFLSMRGIVYDEIQHTDGYWKEWKKITIVDTLKIYDVDESVTKYLLNYKYYSINEVAEMLSFSRPTVYKTINDGKVKAIRINGQMRIKHSDLTEYINTENQ